MARAIGSLHAHGPAIAYYDKPSLKKLEVLRHSPMVCERAIINTAAGGTYLQGSNTAYEPRTVAVVDCQ